MPDRWILASNWARTHELQVDATTKVLGTSGWENEGQSLFGQSLLPQDFDYGNQGQCSERKHTA